jgi:hypothetical protein
MAKPVVVRWWRERGKALAYYACAFALCFSVLALRTGQFQPIHRALMGTVAFIAAYFAVVRVVNETRLTVNDGVLIVRHGPLPWHGGLKVALTEIDTLAVDVPSSRLQLRTARGEEIALVDDMDKRSAARLNGPLSALLETPGRDDN